jgi:hypothetical protein
MSARARVLTRLAIAGTGELMVSADLSKSATARIIKEYARLGLELIELN